MHNGKNNGGMLGFQGFNSFNGGNQHFNALSSASNYNNQQLNNSSISQPIDNSSAQSTDLPDVKSLDDNKNANQTSLKV